MYRIIAPLLLILIVSIAAAQTTQPAVKLAVTTQSMGRVSGALGKKADVTIQINPDQSHCALFIREDKQTRVIFDGKEIATHSWVVPGGTALADDTGTLFYIVQDDSGMHLMIDGKPQKTYYEILPPYRTTSDGRHVAYIARKERGGGQFVVHDGTEGKVYDKIQSMNLSPDVNRPTYMATRGKDSFVVVGETEIPLPADVTVAVPGLSSDAKHPFYKYVTSRGHFAVFNEQTYGPYDYLDLNTAPYSWDGMHWKFLAKKEGQRILIEDGQVVATAKIIDFVHRSPDSKRLFYLVSDDLTRDEVKLDGKTLGTYGNKQVAGNMFAFSPDSSKLAYVVKHAEDKVTLYVDGREYQTEYRVGMACFSPDSKRMAYIIAKTDEKHLQVAVDGVPFPATHRGIASVSICFSPDGEHVAYVADSPRGYAVYIDGVAGPDNILSYPALRLVWADNHTLRFIATDKNNNVNAYRVTIQPQ